MASLPAEVSFGTITGKIIIAVKDDTVTPADPDTHPDAKAATGFVTFAPTSMLISQTSDVIILPQPIVVALEAGTGAFSVDLIATDDPDITPLNWAYTVAYTINEGFIEPHNIWVPANTATDLSDVLLAGEPLTPTQAEMLTNRILYLENELAQQPKLYVQEEPPTDPEINDIWVKI